jgi:Asp-tRNA(Asn)/Glu-tRNA(Gln) amidotransferase A subunit family amidase
VRDSAVLLDLTHGPELGSRYVAPPPSGTFASALEKPPRQLRIAFHWETRSGVAPHAECIAAVKSAAALCEQLGHIVQPAAPKLDFERLGRAFGCAVLTAVAVAVHRRALERGVGSLDDELEETTRAYVRIGQTFPAVTLYAANDAFMEAALGLSQFMASYDVILSPTMGSPPVPLGSASLMQPAEKFDAATMAFSCFTALYNQTGQPAMSVPLHWTPQGLPVGVQFAARFGEEQLLLSLARQLEEARPWFNRCPVL